MSGIVNDTLPRRIERTAATLLRYSAFVLAAAGLGALAGVAWWALTPLSAFTVGDDGRANASQRDLTSMIAADAWYSLLGVVAGALIGTAAWRLLRRTGWGVAVVALLAALAAGLVCWVTGHSLGPDDFAARLAAAAPGEVVPVELGLRATVAVMVWPFAAMLPVLIGASLGADPEAPPVTPRSDASAHGRGGTDPRGTVRSAGPDDPH